MDTKPDRKALTHQRIVETASHAIRAAGFQGVGVADIMKRAGLTHGGFYAHFPSRDALLAEALDHAGQESRERVEEGARRRKGRGISEFRAFVEGYLSDRHLEEVGTGCPVAALVSEVPRQAPEVREAALQRVQALVARIESTLPDASRADANVIAGQLVGALQLARAFGPGAEARGLLADTRAALLARFDVSSPR